LNDEQKGIEDLARKFAREEILPVAAEHDKTGEVIFLMPKSFNYRVLLNSSCLRTFLYLDYSIYANSTTLFF